jgi:hypothetical protein
MINRNLSNGGGCPAVKTTPNVGRMVYILGQFECRGRGGCIAGIRKIARTVLVV